MPALPATPKTLRVAVSALDDAGRQIMSRLYVTYTGAAPTAAQLNTFCATLATSWGTNLKALVSTHLTLDEIEATDLSSSTGAVGIANPSTAGTRTGNPVPISSAFVVSYEINRRYRGGHPRGYWCFGTSNDLATEAIWSTTLQTAVVTGWAAFITSIGAAGWAGAGTLFHSNVSYYDGFTAVENMITHRWRNVPNVRVAPVIDAVVSYVYRLPIGSQRRRLR